MSSPRTSKLRAVWELESASLLLAVAPAFALAASRWLVFAKLLQVGPLTAFYYFRSTLDDSRTLWLLLIVSLVVQVAYFVFGARSANGDARKYAHWAIAIVWACLLLLTGYELHKSPWHPSLSAPFGIASNVCVALVFGVLGWVLFGALTRSIPVLGLVVAGLLVLAPNAYFQYRRSASPVLFTDVADEVGLKELNNSLGVAWGDYDNDGWPDLYVSNHLPATTDSLLYRNLHGVFAAARPMAKGDMHGAAWGDYDNDGNLDLFVAGGNDTPHGPAYPNLLFHNESGKLREIGGIAGVDEPGGRAWGGAWADFNNDGLLDLFVVNYFTSNDLFLNKGNGTFENVSKSAGVTDTDAGGANPAGTWCASWADYDGDNRMDLVTAGIHSGIALYRNNGDGTFSDVARQAGLVAPGDLGTEKDPRGPTGCTWGDYDNDGDLDLFVTVVTNGETRNLLFQNRGDGTFAEVGAAAGVGGKAASRAAFWADFDNDGRLDLFVVNEASSRDAAGWNQLYLNQGNGKFTEVDADAAGVAGFPYLLEGTTASVDYDDDGFVDIYVNDQLSPEERPLFLRRNLLLRNHGNANHWLEIRLRGTLSNRDGVGAKISLTAGGKPQFRERGSESHTFAQNSGVIHFGLGGAKAAEQIVVKWPSGRSQTLTDVAANRIITITEPEAR